MIRAFEILFLFNLAFGVVLSETFNLDSYILKRLVADIAKRSECRLESKFPDSSRDYLLNSINKLREAEGINSLKWDDLMVKKAEDLATGCKWFGTVQTGCDGYEVGALESYIGQLSNIDMNEWITNTDNLDATIFAFYSDSKGYYDAGKGTSPRKIGDPDGIGKYYAHLGDATVTKIGCAVPFETCITARFVCVVDKYIRY